MALKLLQKNTIGWQLVIKVPTQGSSNFEGDFSQNGWTKLPNGLILQWGRVNTIVPNMVSATFPIPFPNSCFMVTATEKVTEAAYALRASIPSTTGVTFSWDKWNNIGAGSMATIMYVAIGY